MAVTVGGFLLLLGEVLTALWFPASIMGTQLDYWPRVHFEVIEIGLACLCVLTVPGYLALVSWLEP